MVQTEPENMTRTIVLIVCLSFWSGIIFGFETGVIAGAGPLIVEHFDLSPLLQGVLTSAILLGAIIGCAGAGELAERLGRKKALAIAAIICIVSPTVGVLFDDFSVVCLFRVLLGISVGLCAVVVPLYVSEVSPVHLRGTLGTLFQLSICFGILVAYLINFAFCLFKETEECYEDNEDAWRYQLAIGAIPGVFLLVLLLVLPESPRWLLMHTTLSESRENIGQITPKRAQKGEKDPLLAPDSASVNAGERSKGKADGLPQDSQEVTYAEVFSHTKPMFAGFMLAFSQQFTGINTLIYYTPDILENAGFSDVSLIATLGVGVWNFLSVCVSLYLVERLPRRSLLLGGLGIMAAACGVLSIGFLLFPDDVAPFAIPSLILFIFGFEIGPGPLFFVVGNELMPQRVRGRAMSFLTLLTWVFNLIISLAFPPLLSAPNGEAIVFLVFTGIGLGSVIVLRRVLPETKGLSLEAVVVP